MFSVSTFWFVIITILFLLWYLLIRREKDGKSVYFLYYCFNFCVFYGPLLYYKLGYTGYSNAISNESLEVFYYINVLVGLLNIIIYEFYKKNRVTMFLKGLSSIKFSKIHNFYFLDRFYSIILVVVLLYLFAYRSYFPLISLISEGELGERLDISGAIPFYILFSAIFMVFVPSAFLYFKYRYPNQRLLSFLLFVLTLFCLSAGGNKGIVSFFLIFYVIFNSRGGFLKYFALFCTLAVIYAIFKGITEVNENSLSFMMESPFRRLFAAQGSGYIARIDMLMNRLFIDGYSIKHQVYTYIYHGTLGSGSSPTHFTGDLIVEVGYIWTLLIYVIYLLIFVRLLNTLSILFSEKEDSFILWGFFVMAYITTNSEITTANGIRFGFIMINLYFIYYCSKLKHG